MRINRFPYPALLGLVLSVAISYQAEAATEKPNILLVVADDMGWTDLGSFGSEIDTPQLDALASNGLRFSQFYNTAKCHSSRVSLLTGQYCIAAGDTSLGHAVTSAEVLGCNGYFTAMTGKWHLKQEPTDFGFQRYFGHLSGATNYFNGNGSFRLDRKPWKVPKSDFYTTVADVDFAIDFLSESASENKPFFLYLAFNAVHTPMHAKRKVLDSIEGFQRPRRRKLAAMTGSLVSCQISEKGRLRTLPRS